MAKERLITKTFKLSPELLEQVEAAAKKRNLSESQLIRQSIENTLPKEFEDPIWFDVGVGKGQTINAPLSAIVGEYLKSVKIILANNRELLHTILYEVFDAWRAMKKAEKRKALKDRKVRKRVAPVDVK